MPAVLAIQNLALPALYSYSSFLAIMAMANHGSAKPDKTQQLEQIEAVPARLLANLLYTTDWLKSELKDFYEPFGITYQQHMLLKVLKKHASKPLSTLQLRKLMLGNMSDTSRLVERLTKKDLVAKKPHQTDKRLVEVQLAPKGNQLLQELMAKETEQATFFGALTEGEQRILISLLNKMRRKRKIT